MPQDPAQRDPDAECRISGGSDSENDEVVLQAVVVRLFRRKMTSNFAEISCNMCV